MPYLILPNLLSVLVIWWVALVRFLVLGVELWQLLTQNSGQTQRRRK